MSDTPFTATFTTSTEAPTEAAAESSKSPSPPGLSLVTDPSLHTRTPPPPNNDLYSRTFERLATGPITSFLDLIDQLRAQTPHEPVEMLTVYRHLRGLLTLQQINESDLPDDFFARASSSWDSELFPQILRDMLVEVNADNNANVREPQYFRDTFRLRAQSRHSYGALSMRVKALLESGMVQRTPLIQELVYQLKRKQKEETVEMNPVWAALEEAERAARRAAKRAAVAPLAELIAEVAALGPPPAKKEIRKALGFAGNTAMKPGYRQARFAAYEKSYTVDGETWSPLSLAAARAQLHRSRILILAQEGRLRMTHVPVPGFEDRPPIRVYSDQSIIAYQVAGKLSVGRPRKADGAQDNNHDNTHDNTHEGASMNEVTMTTPVKTKTKMKKAWRKGVHVDERGVRWLTAERASNLMRVGTDGGWIQALAASGHVHRRKLADGTLVYHEPSIFVVEESRLKQIMRGERFVLANVPKPAPLPKPVAPKPAPAPKAAKAPIAKAPTPYRKDPTTAKKTSADLRRCTNCTTSMAATAKFCGQCGTPAPVPAAPPKPRNCVQCHQRMAAIAAFCSGCGTKAPA